MNTTANTVLAAALTMAAPAFAQITFYEDEGFRGRVHTTNGALDNFAGWGFNGRASSVVVEKGRWEVCEDVGFRGRCTVLRTGSYEQLSSMGLNDRLSSVRPARARPDDDYIEISPSMARPNYEYRQRPRERLFEVSVTSVRAVLGPPEQRCWVEPRPEHEHPNDGRGVIGHRAGGGLVQRCRDTRDDKPAYWEVGYSFRGNAHSIQMSAPPGPTVTVNRYGEPRM